jgi:hypothetical protein
VGIGSDILGEVRSYWQPKRLRGKRLGRGSQAGGVDPDVAELTIVQVGDEMFKQYEKDKRYVGHMMSDDWKSSLTGAIKKQMRSKGMGAPEARNWLDGVTDKELEALRDRFRVKGKG